MNKLIYQGSEMSSEIVRQNGWVLGSFADGLAKTNHVEVKLWRYNGKIKYNFKTYPGPELIIVESGILEIIIRHSKTDKIIYQIGDKDKRSFIFLSKNLERKVRVVKAPVWGTSVRWKE